MKNLFAIALAFVLALSQAKAFILFGSTGNSVDADHANNIDNGNGTNVNLSGLFFGEMHFDDGTPLALTLTGYNFDHSVTNYVNQTWWPNGSQAASAVSTGFSPEIFPWAACRLLYPSADFGSHTFVNFDGTTISLYTPDGFSLSQSSIDSEIAAKTFATNLVGTIPSTNLPATFIFPYTPSFPTIADGIVYEQDTIGGNVVNYYCNTGGVPFSAYVRALVFGNYVNGEVAYSWQSQHATNATFCQMATNASYATNAGTAAAVPWIGLTGAPNYYNFSAKDGAVYGTWQYTTTKYPLLSGENHLVGYFCYGSPGGNTGQGANCVGFNCAGIGQGTNIGLTFTVEVTNATHLAFNPQVFLYFAGVTNIAVSVSGGFTGPTFYAPTNGVYVFSYTNALNLYSLAAPMHVYPPLNSNVNISNVCYMEIANETSGFATNNAGGASSYYLIGGQVSFQ